MDEGRKWLSKPRRRELRKQDGLDRNTGWQDNAGKLGREVRWPPTGAPSLLPSFRLPISWNKEKVEDKKDVLCNFLFWGNSRLTNSCKKYYRDTMDTWPSFPNGKILKTSSTVSKIVYCVDIVKIQHIAITTKMPNVAFLYLYPFPSHPNQCISSWQLLI